MLEMLEQDNKDNNLIVIAAVEGYAQKHNMETANKRDFGQGFYTTTIQVQAEAWAKNIALRNKSTAAYVEV